MDRYSLTPTKRANGAYVKATDVTQYLEVADAAHGYFASLAFTQGEDYAEFMRRQGVAYHRLMVALAAVGRLPDGQPLYLPGTEYLLGLIPQSPPSTPPVITETPTPDTAPVGDRPVTSSE